MKKKSARRKPIKKIDTVKLLHVDTGISLVRMWQNERKFFDKRQRQKIIMGQLAKMTEETGELAGAISRSNLDGVKDAIGDSLVVLTGLAELYNTSLRECLEIAYNSIKDRKGEMRNGVFVKEEDL